MNQRKAVYLSPVVYPAEKPRSAPEVRAQQNLTALRSLGYETTVITAPDPQQRIIVADKVVWVEPFPLDVFVKVHLRRSYFRRVARIVRQELTESSTLLFCEHWHALLCSPRHSRLVYSCHDLESELMRWRRLRKSTGITLKTRLYWKLASWLEWRLLRRAKRAICVSASEAKKIHNRLRIPVEYIPTVGELPALPLSFMGQLGATTRFWFYGGSGATSNKIMLDHLAGGLFDLLQANMPGAEFHQLGAYQTYDADKIEWLHRHFTIHGFVDDLAQVFQRGDFCLIPYQHDTGFRTKIPEVCGYGVICAGYPVTFACCPEMRDGYNCVIADTPAALAEKLARVARDDAARERLAAGAIETRQKDFSFTTLLERYRHILDF